MSKNFIKRFWDITVEKDDNYIYIIFEKNIISINRTT